MARVTKAPVPTEAEIQKSILAVLRFHGVHAWRQNTGAFAGEYKGRSRFIRFGVKGQADIVGLLGPTFGRDAGRMIAVEVKRPGNRPTPEQVRWLIEINDAGGFAFWATSAQTVDHAVRAVLLNPGLRVEMTADGLMDLTDEGV
jgi:hypothetical protein